jgi:cytolysin-activating lysine-acyltransferase
MNATTPKNTAATTTPPQTMRADEMESLAKFAKEQASLVLGKVPMLGPVTWLMMQQSATRHTLLSELEWRVMPALVLDQAKIYMRENAPIAYVSWAKMSEHSAARYKNPPHHLMAADWKSGDQIWIIDLITPFGGGQEVMKDLREKVFAGHTVQQLVPTVGGEAKALVWPAV